MVRDYTYDEGQQRRIRMNLGIATRDDIPRLHTPTIDAVARRLFPNKEIGFYKMLKRDILKWADYTLTLCTSPLEERYLPPSPFYECRREDVCAFAKEIKLTDAAQVRYLNGPYGATAPIQRITLVPELKKSLEFLMDETKR